MNGNASEPAIKTSTIVINNQNSTAVLHRAPLVVPVSGPPIEAGAVLCRDGAILEVGRFARLRLAAGRIIDHDGCVITPALINAHAHLELSHLSGLGRMAAERPFPDFPAWIAALLQARALATASREEIRAAARSALADLRETGTIMVADIGNRPESARFHPAAGIEVAFQQEFLGLSRVAVEEAHRQLSVTDPLSVCTAHAPYSTAAELIKTLKSRGGAARHLFSVHVAESAAELEFLRTGGGPFRAFLEERGAWDGSFQPPASGAVAYLNRLGVLDAQTLCVHCVHVTGLEVAMLARQQAKVCLCPGSNRSLGVGKPPVAGMLAAGLLPALGTDSLATNPRLDLWQEMRQLREDHPDLDPEMVFAMATRGGAAALGVENRLGSLAPGKSARMLAVQARVFTPDEIFEDLTCRGQQVQIAWLS